MRRKIIIGIACVLAVAVAGSLAWGISKTSEGKNTANEIGQSMNESVQNLIAEEDKPIDEDDILGVINNEKISKEYFTMRYQLYKTCGSETPAEDTWNELKKEAAEREFAKDKGILPTETEIAEYTNEQREITESTEESHAIVKELLDSAGMTEEYYWSVYKPKYESKILLTRANIDKYAREHNTDIKYKEVKAEILDKDYYDSLE